MVVEHNKSRVVMVVAGKGWPVDWLYLQSQHNKKK
jgi:hypothetical protein